MAQQRDVILIIDDDPDARDVLREAVFDSDAYHVVESVDAADGLLKVRQYQPDLVLLDLHLDDLSGRDMLVALKSQGYRGPLVVMADGGSEKGIVEAFRLGATDYLTRPLREAEVLATVERGLADTRLRRQHNALTSRISSAEDLLGAREHELEALYQIGQSMVALRDQNELFDQILDAAIALGSGDYAILLLRDDATGRLVLHGGRNLHLSLMDRLGEAIQDSLAELVMTSREPLAMAGEGLQRFSLPRDIRAVAYLPLLVQNGAIGVLAVGSRAGDDGAFGQHHMNLLRILADYTALAVLNVRLFGMVKQRARTYETATRDWQSRIAERDRQMQAVHSSLTVVEMELVRLAHGKEGHVPPRVGERLLDLGQQVKQLMAVVARLAQPQQ